MVPVRHLLLVTELGRLLRGSGAIKACRRWCGVKVLHFFYFFYFFRTSFHPPENSGNITQLFSGMFSLKSAERTFGQCNIKLGAANFDGEFSARGLEPPKKIKSGRFRISVEFRATLRVHFFSSNIRVYISYYCGIARQ